MYVTITQYSCEYCLYSMYCTLSLCVSVQCLASFRATTQHIRVSQIVRSRCTNVHSCHNKYCHNTISNNFLGSENKVTLSRECCRVPSSAVGVHIVLFVPVGREGVQLCPVQHPVHLPQRPYQAHQAQQVPQKDPHRRGRDHRQEEDQDDSQGTPDSGTT